MSKLVNDNECTLKFSDSGIVVKDKKTSHTDHATYLEDEQRSQIEKSAVAITPYISSLSIWEYRSVQRDA